MDKLIQLVKPPPSVFGEFLLLTQQAAVAHIVRVPHAMSSIIESHD
jgi:hypothetical protein